MVLLIPFQSTPVISGGRAACQELRYAAWACFNPRPSFLAGEPRRRSRVDLYMACFNPRPSFLAGEPHLLMTPCPSSLSFNPRPSFLAGEPAAAEIVAAAAAAVSIHARHFWRASRHLPAASAASGPVSIHARHFWRASPFGVSATCVGAAFQSTPVISGGRASFTICLRWRLWSFNPRPSFLAGEPSHLATVEFAHTVSIHARHFWRASRTITFSYEQHLLVSIHARHFWRASQL